MSAERRTAIRRLLRRHEACAEAVDWSADKEGLQQLWEQCEVPEWLLWSLEQLKYRDDLKLRAFAVACARRHSGLLPQDGPLLRLLSIAEAVARDGAPPDGLLEGWQDGSDAADHAARAEGWSVARAAAINAVRDTVLSDAMEAAKGSSTNAQRAVAWQTGSPESTAEEARWQARELRRLLDQDVPKILGRARAAMIARR